MATLKKNLVYSTILTLSTYLVPLFVFPYISRVLGPEGLGHIDTVESIINYSILFSMMGLTTLGIREIAKHRDSREDLERTFADLFWLNAASTFFIFIVLLLLVFTVPDLSDRKGLFFIGLAKLLFNLFWIEWFFKGLENFKYITIRSVLMRVAFVIAVFCMVRSEDDYWLYYLLWVGLTMGNAVCNWTYRRRYARLLFKGFSPSRYAKPFVMLGLFAIFSAIYTQLNVAILGFKAGSAEVGYYTTATRLYQVLIALFSTLTGVMIPRISVLVKQGDTTEIRRLTMRAFQFLFYFSMPVICFMEIFAPDFIRLFAGEGFDGAVLPMRIVMFQMLVIGTEQIFIMQLLIPMRKDRHIVVASFLGASVCIATNLILVPSMGSTGAALAWFSAEVTVMSIASYWVYRFLGITFPLRMFMRYLLYSLPYFVAGILVWYVISDMYWRVVVAGLLFLAYGFVMEEYILKFKIVFRLLNRKK